MSRRSKSNPALPFWQEGIRFECQGTGFCCTSRGEYGYVYLTADDEAALAQHLGLTLDAFRTLHTEVTGHHRHLADPDKDCIFLEGTRCGVYEARPQQCRTWPFWPENLESPRAWQRDVARTCAGVGKGRLYSAQEIQAILDSQAEE